MLTKKSILENKNYITTHSIEEIVKKTDMKLPLVLTPFKSGCTDISFNLDLFSKTKEGVIKVTPSVFLDNEKLFDGYLHIAVESVELMNDFGYKNKIKYIGKRFKFIFLMKNNIKYEACKEYSDTLTILSLNKYILRYVDEYKYISIFVLYKIYSNITIICKDVRKMILYCEIMKIEASVLSLEEHHRCNTDVSIVFDGLIDVQGKKIFYIGNYDCNYNNVRLDFSKISKYIYRIRDVLKSLTPSVIKGYKKLNVERFKNIHR